MPNWYKVFLSKITRQTVIRGVQCLLIINFVGTDRSLSQKPVRHSLTRFTPRILIDPRLVSGFFQD